MKLTDSPWGRIDWQKEIAPGIISVSTPSHGGYWLSPDRIDAMPANLKKTDSRYCPVNWYEEDCEWSRVALAFPECFTEEKLENAKFCFIRQNRPPASLLAAKV